MRKILISIVAMALMLSSCQQKQQAEPVSHNNLFSALLGKSEAEVQARIDSVWTHFFTPGDINKYDADGEKCV
jgi:PBP1b-binding outer membrane lipoprotein LpoB